MAQGQSAIDSLQFAIIGSGGAGAITTGTMILDIAAREGWYGLLGRSAGPQIRGGEAAALVRLAASQVDCLKETFDLYIAIDWNNADRFDAEIEMGPDSLVIGDTANGEPPRSILESGATILDIPLKEIAESIPQGRQNMVAVGMALGLIGLSPDTAGAVIEGKLADKGSAAIEASKAGLAAGMAEAEKIEFPFSLTEPSGNGKDRWLVSGNEAAGMGAVRGGVRFAAAYPITPATEILEWLAPALAKVGGTLVQAEDELASINMVIGAAFGGKPSITATSGPGLALMIESLGLATASEIPIVVVDVMRGGPSTGIPTKSEQSDLNAAIYGCHGDAPHIVVAPLSVADCLFTTQWATHLAEQLQGPSIVLSDQFLGQTKAVIDRPADVAFFTRRDVAEDADESYRRYAVTADGVSPMALPGTAGGQYTADGLTHAPSGTPSSRGEDHIAQLDKRQKKIDTFNYGDHWADIEGEGATCILTWGSLTGAAREAIARMKADGEEFKLVAMRLLSPLLPDQVATALAGTERLLIVEQSHSGQFHRHLRGTLDLPGDVEVLNRPGPLPIQPAEIIQKIRDWRS